MLFILHSKSPSLGHSVFFQCFLIINILKNQYSIYKHNLMAFIVFVFHIWYSMVSHFEKNVSFSWGLKWEGFSSALIKAFLYQKLFIIFKSSIS